MEFLGTLGPLFANLVTPESVERLLNFLEGLGEFMPVAGQILDLFGRLDILNIFVGILNMVGELITPLMPHLLELADVIGTSLVGATETWAPLLAQVGETLGPLIEAVVILASAALPVLIDIISSAIGYIENIAEALVGADSDTDEYRQAVEVMGEVVKFIFELIGNVIKVQMDFIGGALRFVSELLRGDFSGAFDTAYETVSKVLGDMGIDIDEVVNFFEDFGRNVDQVMQDIGSAIGAFGDSVADVFSGVIGWISDAVDWFWSLFGAANSASSAAANANGGGGGGRGALRQATGGLHTSMRHVIVGEAGPEAIVPLRRNLAQVDPAVRWLSAIAQGKYASGGLINGGGGGGMVVSPGAITVYEAGDSRRTANDVLTRLSEFAYG